MWQLTVFSYLLIFHGHKSQPITDDTENSRHARQLDFGECCPCPSAGEANLPDFRAQDTSWPAGDPSPAQARNMDDCTSRTRYPDSEGATSILFPTSMRSDGAFVSPVEKNEDPKPLLHPEVDLASSVLQTLREATDEEYQDALARDAARSMVKAAGETIFEDAMPEASTGNIVTIIVSPKNSNDLGDAVPQETHVQEPRCTDSPLEGVITNIGKMSGAPKPPTTLRDFFGLPRIKEPVEISQRNILDKDSTIDASNMNERVVHADDHQLSRGTQGLRKYVPLIKLNLNEKNLETPYTKSNVDYNDCSINKVPDMRRLSLKNKLSDMVSSRSLQDNKISSLPLIPKIKVNNLFSKQNENNEAQDFSLNNFQEQFAGKKSFPRNKPHLKSILETTSPVGLKNYLKLKDVELIRLKDIVDTAPKHIQLNRPKFELPAIFNKNINTLFKVENKELKQKITNYNSNEEIFEPEVSPSNVIERINSDNCNSEVMKTYESNVKYADDKISSPEIIDTAPSSSNIKLIEDEIYSKVDNSHSRESIDNIDDCMNRTLPGTEKNLSQATENYLYTEIPHTKGDNLNKDTIRNITPNNMEKQDNHDYDDAANLEDCDNNENDAMTDSSNNVNNVVKTTDNSHEQSDGSFANKNMLNKETRNTEQRVSDNVKSLDTSERQLITPASFNKALSSIKENIIKKLEDLKKHKIISKDPKHFNRKLIRDDDTAIKELDSVKNEPLNADCQNEDNQGQENEESILTTTLKPDNCNDEDLEKTKDPSNEITMQDLQKISDLMLQQEEQERESKTVECNESFKNAVDSKMPLEVNSRDTGSRNRDTEQSANSPNEVLVDSTNSEGIQIENIEDSEDHSCQSKLPNQVDTHTEASDVVINTVVPCDNIMESPLLNTEILQPNRLNILKSPLPDLQDLIKLEPLPTLEDIKLKLTNLFDKTLENGEVLPGLEKNSMTESNSIMATDASTNRFQSKLPALRLEDVNLDILQLKPQSSLLSKIPIIDLHSYRTKLPLPNDLRIKPMKLQSALEDNGSIFGATVTVGRNKVQPNNIHKFRKVSDNLWDSIAYLNDRTSMRNNLEEILNAPRKSDSLKKKISDITANSNTLRDVQHMLESTIKKATKKPDILQTPNLLELISTNHEDVHDKLTAIHVDLNDRLETMRNNLFNNFGTSETRNTNTNTFTGFSNRNKGATAQTGNFKPTPRREPKKKNNLYNRRWDRQRQTKIELPQKLRDQRKHKMSTSASVPIPRTIEVPELTIKLAKSLRPALQRTSSMNPDIHNPAISSVKESSVAYWKKPTLNTLRNTPLEKQINPLKDGKIKVLFSSTSRPSTVTAAQSRKIISSHLQHTPQLYKNLDDSGIANEHGTGRHKELTLQRKVPILGTKNDLQPRAKVLESPFLSKVKESIKTRLSKGNLPISLKKTDVSFNVDNYSLLDKNNDDMSRSASEHTDMLLGQTLKENVSYKCKMMCTKE